MVGSRLRAIVQEAGLCPVGMIGSSRTFGPSDEAGIAFLVETMRLAKPLIVGTGVATAQEIGMDTFQQRPRDDNQRTQAEALIPCSSARGRQPARSDAGDRLTWAALGFLCSRSLGACLWCWVVL
jgi:hypothetical protein